MMNLGRVDVLLAQSGTVDSKHYAQQAFETFKQCHSTAPHCALDAHIQVRVETNFSRRIVFSLLFGAD